ncbi:M48 family peptidase [Acinetobacter sp. AM]|uniref:M48 family metallopeptidase n=1 Tax=Acinetobacter sp. AM TaxID=2170730 RepID=UPI000DE76728|nr:SprT family zinc-dependent metalloprotease [Acinetobacter sp. AM]PWB14346.1 M48 family peptidase [Acinetobacter sp. AM]
MSSTIKQTDMPLASAENLAVVYGGGEIPFQLEFSKRKSLEISVHPDKSVFVKAPEGTDHDAIEAKVKKRARWIKRQIRYFDQFDPRTPSRKYVSGESHLYLGKKYRLKVDVEPNNSVALKAGFFEVTSTNGKPDHVKSLLRDWYFEKANFYLNKIFLECWEKFKYPDSVKPNVKIMQLKKRWGSLSKNRTLTLNRDLIKAPKECIEYVIIHELCHLEHHHHGPEFYQLLERSLPDWVRRKQKLEMALI